MPVPPRPPISVLPDLLRWRATSHPETTALVVDGRGSLSFPRWDSRSNALARGLVEQGVVPGDRVALVFDSARWIDFAVSYLAVHKAGAVAVPLGARFTDPELKKIFSHCQPACVVSPADLRPGTDAGWWAQPDDLEEGRDLGPFQAAVFPTDLADILYTSGTTGTPKGVACSHENVVFDLPPERDETAGRRNVTFLHAFPIGTNAGQEVLRVPLRRGSTTALTLRSFDPERFCALVAEHRVQRLQLVPAMAQMIIASQAHLRHDVSSVERIVLGSAPTPPALLPLLTEAFPTAEVWNVYTLTEAGPARTLMRYEPTRAGSVGRPIWDSEVRVVADDGQPVAPGETGEVWIRRKEAPQRHYFRDPVATAAAFGADGWLRTGDLGYQDDDGYLYLVDRRNDLIVSGGFNVSSVEVEGVLYEHPAVSDAAVFGVPHAVLGQDVAAAVVTSGPVTERELQAWARGRLAEHKVPHRVTFMEALPRNPSGKVLKRELREQLSNRPPAPVSAPLGATTEELVASAWKDVLGLEAVEADDEFFDQGGHSLAAVELMTRLEEECGVPLPLALVFEAHTLSELVRAVEKRQQAAGGGR